MLLCTDSFVLFLLSSCDHLSLKPFPSASYTCTVSWLYVYIWVPPRVSVHDVRTGTQRGQKKGSYRQMWAPGCGCQKPSQCPLEKLLPLNHLSNLVLFFKTGRHCVCSPGWHGMCCVSQDGQKLLLILPQQTKPSDLMAGEGWYFHVCIGNSQLAGFFFCSLCLTLFWINIIFKNKTHLAIGKPASDMRGF